MVAAVVFRAFTGLARIARRVLSRTLDHAFRLEVGSLPKSSPPRLITRRHKLQQNVLDYHQVLDSLNKHMGIVGAICGCHDRLNLRISPLDDSKAKPVTAAQHDAHACLCSTKM